MGNRQEQSYPYPFWIKPKETHTSMTTRSATRLLLFIGIVLITMFGIASQLATMLPWEIFYLWIAPLLGIGFMVFIAVSMFVSEVTQ